MPGQATVIIDGKQWTVNVASTYAELTTGLSGVSGIPAQTGVLFDLGYVQSSIEVNTQEMLFNMDVVFISSQYKVLGKCSNVAPGEACLFQATSTPGARYFLEVNAGEAEGVNVGDDVSISGLATTGGIDIGAVMQLLVVAALMVIVMGAIGKGTAWEKG